MDYSTRITYDPTDHNAQLFGYEKAQAGEAWTCNGGIGILDTDEIGQHVRLASTDEAIGVLAYWEQQRQ